MRLLPTGSMQKEELTNLLQHPEALAVSQIDSIKQLIEQYPYFQSLRALHLKGLKNTDSFKYNSSLKKTAAYTTDRSVLFDFITSKEFNQNAISENIKQNTEYLKSLEIDSADDISVNKSMLIDEALKAQIQSTEGVLDPNLFQKKSEERTHLDSSSSDQSSFISIDVENISAEEKLEIGKPLEFDENETHSFTEWLKITDFKPINRESQEKKVAQKVPLESKLKVIDKFISENPKIKPIEDSPNPRLIENEDSVLDKGLMTETLAKIYLEQKNYKKAIQSYKILSLKNPEKSSFFADRIKAIEELQSRNN